MSTSLARGLRLPALLVGIDTEGDNQWSAESRLRPTYDNIYALPRLHALDASTGRPVWEARVAYPQDHFTITMAPRIAKGKVIIGVSGGDRTTLELPEAHQRPPHLEEEARVGGPLEQGERDPEARHERDRRTEHRRGVGYGAQAARRDPTKARRGGAHGEPEQQKQ